MPNQGPFKDKIVKGSQSASRTMQDSFSAPYKLAVTMSDGFFVCCNTQFLEKYVNHTRQHHV